jgi:GT2 family glycosyltransferase
VQHAGVVLDDAWPLHPFVGADPAGLGEHGADVARDVVAVTGACLMARRADLLAVGALSTDFPLSFNDVDLCVRLRRRGLRVVIEPGAVIVHHETLTRTPEISAEEWDRWIGRWGEIEDPWYHPGHHRPDDPDDLRRNADHLPPHPDDRSPPVRLRTTRLRCRVHRARPTRALE